MANSLEGRVAVVTGVARPIGDAIAERLLADGAGVFPLEIGRDSRGAPQHRGSVAASPDGAGSMRRRGEYVPIRGVPSSLGGLTRRMRRGQ